MYNEIYKKKQNSYELYNPQIRLTVDKDKRIVNIFDNGNGMSLDILKNYFLNVGVSYYKSKDYRYMGYDYKPIGNYGIGFLACFMFSQNVKIITKQLDEHNANTIIINRDSEHVCMSSEEIQLSHGTEIVVEYDEFISVFENMDDIRLFISENFILDEVSIFLNHIVDGENKNVNLDLKSLQDSVSEKVSLTNYLNDIEAYANIKFSKACFFKDLKSLTRNKSYFYNEDDYDLYEESEDGFNLYEYVENDQMKYLEIAVIDSSDSEEFNTALDYLDDFQQASNRVKPTYINIIYKEEHNVGHSHIESGDTIIEDYYFESLVSDFGQADDAIAYINQFEQRVVIGEGDLYLGFEIDKQIFKDFYWRPSDKIYCKDILVSNAHLTIPFLLNNLKIDIIALNSKHKDLIPTVTRNDFSEEMKEELSYAVGKAIHMWVLDNLELCKEEKNLIKNFAEKYYSEANIFYKNGV